jgi:hypothetical protein
MTNIMIVHFVRAAVGSGGTVCQTRKIAAAKRWPAGHDKAEVSS